MKTIEQLIRLAEAVSKASHDPDTQNGCVIISQDFKVISATNRLAAGVKPQPERLVRPEKYNWIGHAEQRAVQQAARMGIRLDHSAAIMLFAPCSGCADALINAGVERVIVSLPHHLQRVSPRWVEDWNRASVMFAEADVRLDFWTPTDGCKRYDRIPTEVPACAA